MNGLKKVFLAGSTYFKQAAKRGTPMVSNVYAVYNNHYTHKSLDKTIDTDIIPINQISLIQQTQLNWYKKSDFSEEKQNFYRVNIDFSSNQGTLSYGSSSILNKKRSLVVTQKRYYSTLINNNFIEAEELAKKVNEKGIKIFISYAWANKEVVNQIDQDFQALDVNIERDIRDLGEYQSITKFMKTIRDKDFVFMIISEEYLKSTNCMFEAYECLKNKDYDKKIIPIVLPNAKLYGSASPKISEYLEFWENEMQRIKKACDDKTTSTIYPTDYNRAERIHAVLEEFISHLRDIYAPRLNELKGKHYVPILKYVLKNKVNLSNKKANVNPNNPVNINRNGYFKYFFEEFVKKFGAKLGTGIATLFLSVITGLILLVKNYIKKREQLRLLRNVPIECDNYIKRPEIIKQLENHYKDNPKSVKELLIKGESGMGKTEIAKSYARKYKDEHPNSVVYWFDLSRDLKTQYGRFLEKLDESYKDKSENLSLEKITAKVKDILRTKYKNWLLVFDNLTSYNDLTKENYIPVAGNGQILYTSIHETIPITYDIEEFQEKESVSYIKTIIASINKGIKLESQQIKFDEKLAKQIATKLENVPCFLRAVFGYLKIKPEKNALANFLNEMKVLDVNKLKKYEENIQFRYNKDIYAAWEVFLDSYLKKHPETKNLLRIIAYLDINLQKSFIAEYFTELLNKDILKIEKVFKELSFMIEPNTISDSYKIHNVYQSILRKKFQTKASNTYQELLLFFSKIFIKENLTKDDYKNRKMLLPHVSTLISHLEEEKIINKETKLCKKEYFTSIIKILTTLGFHYTQIGLREKSANVLEETKLIFENNVKINPVNLYKSQKDTSTEAICSGLRDDILNEKNELKKRSSPIFQKLKKIDHELPSIYASLLYTYGRTYFYIKGTERGQKKKLEYVSCLRQALQLNRIIDKEAKRSPSLDTLLCERTGLLYLFLASKNKEDWQFAVDRYTELKKEESVKNDLYFQLFCTRQIVKGVQRIARTTNSKYDIQDRIKSYENLVNNKFKEIEQFERAPVHFNMLGTIYSDKDNKHLSLEKAKTYYKKTVRIEKAKNNGKWNLNFPLADALEGLALIHIQEKKYKLAKKTLQECLSVRKKVYPLSDYKTKKTEELLKKLKYPYFSRFGKLNKK